VSRGIPLSLKEKVKTSGCSVRGKVIVREKITLVVLPRNVKTKDFAGREGRRGLTESIRKALINLGGAVWSKGHRGKNITGPRGRGGKKKGANENFP